jgi:diguanylate cyclase (GGDEF)-like protein/PAS domain S-box-containing protein
MGSLSLKEIGKKVEVMEKEISLHRSVLEVSQDPFFILDQKEEFLKANPKGMEMFIYPWEELRQMAFIDVVPLEEISLVREGFERMRQGKEVCFRTQVVSRLGERIPVEFFGTFRGEVFLITLRGLREQVEIERDLMRMKKELAEKIRERDQYARELSVLKDLYDGKLKEIEQMREEAVLLSFTDDLTGIYNHRFFIQQLTLEVERQKRYPTPLSLLMIDIDYFKHYNDTNGHLAGDQALKAISVLIQRGVRQTDIVARYGGEEFSAILINTGKEGAREIAERVRRNVAETDFPDESAQPNGNLTVSIGVSTFSPSVSTLTDLIREADNALYRAKRTGRNRVEE